MKRAASGSVPTPSSASTPVPAPAPVPVQQPSAEDVARAHVERQIARWAIANGYTGLSPVSLRPIDAPADSSPSRYVPVAV